MQLAWLSWVLHAVEMSRFLSSVVGFYMPLRAVAVDLGRARRDCTPLRYCGNVVKAGLYLRAKRTITVESSANEEHVCH